MKRSKFTESQIIFALKQAETGAKVEEICRKMGISVQKPDRLTTFGRSNVKNYNLHIISYLWQEIDGQLFSA